MTVKVRVTRRGSAEPLPPLAELIAALRSNLRGVEPRVGGDDLRRWTGVVDCMEQDGERDTPMGHREHFRCGTRLAREIFAAADAADRGGE